MSVKLKSHSHCVFSLNYHLVLVVKYRRKLKWLVALNCPCSLIKKKLFVLLYNINYLFDIFCGLFSRN